MVQHESLSRHSTLCVWDDEWMWSKKEKDEAITFAHEIHPSRKNVHALSRFQRKEERKFRELHIIHVNENVTIKRHKLVRNFLGISESFYEYIATISYSIDVFRSWSFQNLPSSCCCTHQITLYFSRLLSSISDTSCERLKSGRKWEFFFPSNHIVTFWNPIEFVIGRN